jgi:hypothetical protein
MDSNSLVAVEKKSQMDIHFAMVQSILASEMKGLEVGAKRSV